MEDWVEGRGGAWNGDLLDAPVGIRGSMLVKNFTVRACTGQCRIELSYQQ